MKYKITFTYVGVKETYEVDGYFFQTPGLMLQKKKAHEGQILRADEKLINFKWVNLDEVLEFDIEELE
jgi:hypothetical protein